MSDAQHTDALARAMHDREHPGDCDAKAERLYAEGLSLRQIGQRVGLSHAGDADHVDGDTWNNDPANLVPACGPCNRNRHQFLRTHCTRGHEYTTENTYPFRRDCPDCPWRGGVEDGA